jgi:hypothetical protein
MAQKMHRSNEGKPRSNIPCDMTSLPPEDGYPVKAAQLGSSKEHRPGPSSHQGESLVVNN